MASVRRAASFAGLAPASAKTSKAARASSRKTNTKCELLLRRALWARGLRYRLGMRGVPGNPDIIFPHARVAVFVDGDFWHGRNLEARVLRLSSGHNPDYWTAKIRSNVERDRRVTVELEMEGWRVIRVWESEVLRDCQAVCTQIADVVTPPAGR